MPSIVEVRDIARTVRRPLRGAIHCGGTAPRTTRQRGATPLGTPPVAEAQVPVAPNPSMTIASRP